METPKKRPSVKGRKKVGSTDFVQPAEEQVPETPQEPVVQEEPKTPRRRVKDKASAERVKVSPKSGGRKVVTWVVGIAVAVVLAVGFFAWNTFLRYDDAVDIKGEWLVSDGSMVVVIDGQNIKMPDATYAYSLDDKKKVITFTFAELSGGGSYEFADGRKTLSISEGEETVAVTTFYKVSDKAKAKPRKLGQKEGRELLMKVAPADQQAIMAAEEAEKQSDAQKDAKDTKKQQGGESKKKNKDASASQEA